MRNIGLLASAALPLLLAACGNGADPADSAVAAGRAPPPVATDDAPPDSAAGGRRYLLERVDDAAVIQIYADQFDALSLREKTLIYHLSLAALAGRDIYYDQRHELALDMRAVLEAIITHPNGIDAAALSEITRYTKLFWLNTGPYSKVTARKFVLQLTPAAFSRAAVAAAAAGASFPTRDGESLESLLMRLEPMFFDADVDPIVTNKTPGPGGDILLSSSNNLYSDVSIDDLAGFPEQHGLNSRLVDRDGELVEEVYRIGGRYDSEIRAIVRHLEDAIPFASAPMADALRALVRWYTTGDDADRMAYDIAWVRDDAPTVDTINGFIEVYMDPRGVKGSWEGLVFYVNPEKNGRIRAFADNAQWFEDHMPYDAAFRKADVRGIVANAVDVVMETGDSGPVTPVGINLPNDQSVREQYGSKSISLENVSEAGYEARPESMRTEFAWADEEVERDRQFGALASQLHTAMHEVIGHASGRLADGFEGTPQAAIRQYYSALEEGRADLIALYFVADPKLAELGIVPEADRDAIARTMYESYTRGTIVQLRSVREGTQLEEDHMRNRQMVVRWLIANTSAIEERTRDGKTYLVMVDAASFRGGVGRLLAEVQRIKSEGDFDAARDLFETYGIAFDPALRDEVVARVDALDLPSYSAYVMPKLTPVTDANGAITDVEISYPLDLTRQMLEYSGHVGL